jgi:uncharacterized protein
MAKFIGRQAELKRLIALKDKKSASFLIVKGRRRVGKSRLIKEFSKYFDQFYFFAGLAPDKKTTAKHQLDEFSHQMARQFKTSMAHYTDWSDALWAVGERVQTGKTLLLFDEISWMASKDPSFLGKIKNFWDLQLKENDQLIFVICGSASSWIDKNILNSTGFVGRISLTLTLEALPLFDCNQFWSDNISAYEKFKILSVTGGIPKYLEEINPKISAEENIKNLCFTKGGFLVDEFEKIFSNIFMRKSIYYKHILQVLSEGEKDQKEIYTALNKQHQSRISEYLWELEQAGFITRHYTWNIQTGQDGELSQYRLSDNYVRFYLKYIDKNLTKINREAFNFKSLSSFSEWYTIMGLQFENLVLNNRYFIHSQLNLHLDDIVSNNPFFQRKTTRNLGCQIDYMIQTRFQTLYVCEIKFSKAPIGMSVIQELKSKIRALKYPKGFSCRPVLIHVNGVTDEVVESEFFDKIIDMTDALA